MGKKVLVYPELCHACGGCSLACPAGAITEFSRRMGKLETGQAGDIQFVHGLLDVGQVMSPPLIKAVKAATPDAELIFIDSPPGTSCPVIESVRDCDFVVLVTEPTPFGLNDLQLAFDMIKALKLPFGVVINRAGIGDMETASYCQKHNIKILAEIPDDREIAQAYSTGRLACEAIPKYQSLFKKLLEDILNYCGCVS